jgi:hypothetical protein
VEASLTVGAGFARVRRHRGQGVERFFQRCSHDRTILEATGRFADAGAKHREQGGNTNGSTRERETCKRLIGMRFDFSRLTRL